MLFGFSFFILLLHVLLLNAFKSSTRQICSSLFCNSYWWNVVWIYWYIRFLARNEMVRINAVATTGNPWFSIFASSVNESQPTMPTVRFFRYLIKTLLALAVVATNNCTSSWQCLPALFRNILINAVSCGNRL